MKKARGSRIPFLLIVACAATALLAASGCARIRIHNKSGNPKTQGEVRETHASAIFGLYDITPPIDLGSRCKDGWQDITTEVRAPQILLRVVTLGMYTPWSVEASCLAPKPKVQTEPF